MLEKKDLSDSAFPAISEAGEQAYQLMGDNLIMGVSGQVEFSYCNSEFKKLCSKRFPGSIWTRPEPVTLG